MVQILHIHVGPQDTKGIWVLQGGTADTSHSCTTAHCLSVSLCGCPLQYSSKHISVLDVHIEESISDAKEQCA